MEPHHGAQRSVRSPGLLSKVDEKVQALIHQLSASLGYSSMHKPGFCQSPPRRTRGGNFLHAPLQSSLGPYLSNKMSYSPFGVHLISQPAHNPRLLSTGFNPAHPTFGAWLNTLLNSNFCETLGHENTPKYLSNCAPKN